MAKEQAIRLVSQDEKVNAVVCARLIRCPVVVTQVRRLCNETAKPTQHPEEHPEKDSLLRERVSFAVDARSRAQSAAHARLLALEVGFEGVVFEALGEVDVAADFLAPWISVSDKNDGR